MTVKNLVVHFDQEKFEELLSGGGPVHNTRKHRRVSAAIAPRTVDQTAVPARAVSKPVPTAPLMERSSSHSLSASAKGKSTKGQHDVVSCDAEQVPHEPKTVQSEQIWKAKPQASMCEATHEVEIQLRLSHEDRGKSPLSVDSGAYTTSTPKGANRVLSHEAGTKALCSANCFRGNTKNKALPRASFPKPSSTKFAPKMEL